MTISVRQTAITSAFGTAAPSLASTPVAGNLLVAFANERSGETAFTMNSAGWTLGVARYQSPADGTYRKAHATWYKIAGASEPTSVSVTTATGGIIMVGIAEWQGDAGEMSSIAFGAAVATGSDAVAAFYTSGTTSSVASTSKILIGHCYTKVGGTSELPYSTWNLGTDTLTEFAESDGATSALDASWAWATSSVTGTNSVRADKDSGSVSAERGGIVSLLVFTYGGGGTAHTQTPTDATGSTDTRALTQGKVVTDAAAGTDATALAQGKSATNTAGLTDSATASVGRTVTATDAAGLTDATTIASGTGITSSDTEALTDSLTLDRSLAVVDSSGLTDSVTIEASGSGSVTPTDSTGLTDATATDRGHVSTDTAGLADSVSLSLSRTATDTATLTDAATVENGKAVTATDSAGMSDAVVIERFTAITDDPGLADLAALTRGLVITEAAGLADSVGVALVPAGGIVTPADRTTVIAAESRTIVVPAESRTTIIPAETRTLEA